MKNILFNSFIIVFVINVVFGICLFYDPYLLTGKIQIEGGTVWSAGAEAEALILFNLSSRGFISAYYPVEVSSSIRVINETLLSYLKEKNFVDLDIAGAYSCPIRYGPLGIYQGTISLHFDGNNKFQGSSKMIFPYKGDRYFFQIFAYDSMGEASPPIYTMNVSDIGKSIPPVFLIEETFATRSQFENSNQKTGLAIAALGISSIGIIVNVQRRNAEKTRRTISIVGGKQSKHKMSEKH